MLTTLLLSSLNDLQVFFVFSYATLLEFSCAKHYRTVSVPVTIFLFTMDCTRIIRITAGWTNGTTL